VLPDPSKDVIGAGWPAFLPDGEHFLYQSTSANPEGGKLWVGSLDGKPGKPLFNTPSQVVYAAPGYLLFVRESTLVAQPFDAETQELRGEAVPVGEGLGLDNVGLAAISVSSNGILAYRAGQGAERRLVWMDRNGKETPALPEVGRYLDTWLSPDGQRMVFADLGKSDKADLWIRDLVRGITTRFTFAPEDEFDPVWSPDGRQIAYSLQRKVWDLYVKDAAGTGEPRLLLENGEDKFSSDFSRDGAYLVYVSRPQGGAFDLWALPLKGEDRKPFPLRKTQFAEQSGMLSPDGRYLAFQSNESGRFEVYVQEFPEAHSKWQVSADGGREPYWRGDGREIFYRAPNADVMAVPVEKADTFVAGTPKPLFRPRFPSVVARGLYRPAPDGQRFLVLSALGREALAPATVILNWTSALK
jgi:Tol biopolymer transport system component